LGTNTKANTSGNNYMNSTALGYGATIDASNQIVLGTSSEKIKIPGSYVGIGGVYNISTGYALDVSGNLNVSGTTTNVSDYRIKESVIPLDNTFIVDKLNPVTYFNTRSGKQDIGLIAHELQEIYPILVNGEKDGENLQSVNYIGVIPILIKEIKESKKEIQELKKEIQELKKEIQELKKEIQEIDK